MAKTLLEDRYAIEGAKQLDNCVTKLTFVFALCKCSGQNCLNQKYFVAVRLIKMTYDLKNIKGFELPLVANNGDV